MRPGVDYTPEVILGTFCIIYIAVIFNQCERSSGVPWGEIIQFHLIGPKTII